MNEPQEIMNLHKKLIASKKFLFPEKGKVNVSSKHGVYIIYNTKSEVVHVGRTQSGIGGLNQRLYNHISKAGVFYSKYLKPRGIEMRGKYFFRYIEVSSPRTRGLLEVLTAGLLCPAHFGTGEKRK
jgi:hypothetical protein